MEIDETLLRKLLARQCASLSSLPISELPTQGWCNRTFRIGDSLIARLPRRLAYAQQPQRERRALDALNGEVSMELPQIVVRGEPSNDFAFNWSIYKWIEGACLSLGADLPMQRIAQDVAQFLVGLHCVPVSVALKKRLKPSKQNFFRGGDLRVYDAQTQAALALLVNRFDTSRAHAIWQEALAHVHAGRSVWVHGDIANGNLIQRDSRLVGVIDWGNVAVGDPACDLVIAWKTFSGDARRAFVGTVNQSPAVDSATWLRARGWALWKASILVAGLSSSNANELAAAGQTLAELLAPDSDLGAQKPSVARAARGKRAVFEAGMALMPDAPLDRKELG